MSRCPGFADISYFLFWVEVSEESVTKILHVILESFLIPELLQCFWVGCPTQFLQ